MERFKLAYIRRYSEAHDNTLMVDTDGLLLYAQAYSMPGFEVRELGVYEGRVDPEHPNLLAMWETIERHGLAREGSGAPPGPLQLSVEFHIEGKKSTASHIHHALGTLPEGLTELESRARSLIANAAAFPLRTFSPSVSLSTHALRAGDELRLSVRFGNRGRSRAVVPNARIFGGSNPGEFRMRAFQRVEDPEHGTLWIPRAEIDLSRHEFAIGPAKAVSSSAREMKIPAGGSLDFTISLRWPKCPEGHYRMSVDWITAGDPVDAGKNRVLGAFFGDPIELEVLPRA